MTDQFSDPDLPYVEVVRVPKLGACWEWALSRNESRGGYGQVNRNGKILKAHRYAYEKLVGPIPDNLLLLHHCDNPPCIRPLHLFPGTHADNAADKVAKGRNVSPRFCSEENPSRKLLKDQAMIIRVRSIDGESPTTLAQEFGITKQNVFRIKKGETWNQSTMTK